MVEVESNLTPWYTVVDPNGEEQFEIQFYKDSFSYKSGFTFDSPDGNDWYCYNLDEENLTIYADLTKNMILGRVSNYLESQGQEIPEDINYGYVEAEMNNSSLLEG